MTYQLEDFADDFKAEKEQHQSEHLEQLRQQVGVGNVEAEIQGDSKWHVHMNHMDVLIQTAEREVAGYQQSLADGDFLGPEKYGQVRVKLAQAKGFVRGLKQSKELLTVLVERGEKAAEEMYQLTKGTESE